MSRRLAKIETRTRTVSFVNVGICTRKASGEVVLTYWYVCMYVVVNDATVLYCMLRVDYTHNFIVYKGYMCCVIS